MSTDRIGEPWSGATYNGFSGPGQPDYQPQMYRRVRRPHRRHRTSRLLAAGVAGAVGLGLVLGIWARPDVGEVQRAPEPMEPVTPGTAASQQVKIEVAPPTVAPAPKAAGRLEVLPPDLVQQPRRAAVARTPPPEPDGNVVRAAASPPRIVRAPPPRTLAPPDREPEPQFAAAPRFAPQPAARPSFNCRYARTPSEQMVCADPELARADRRLADAYRRAVAAGVPARALRAEQDDWLIIREDAARRSPRAVASVYEQRIEELDALADDPG